MFLPNPNDLTPLGEKYKSSFGFMYGEDERGIFKMAFDFSRNATLTTAAGRQIDKFIGKVQGIDQGLMSPEQAEKEYGVKIDESKTLDDVRYLAQIQNMSNYVNNQIAFKRKRVGSFNFWKNYMGGVLAGATLDPIMLVSAGATGVVVRAGLKVAKASKVAQTLYSSNRFIKYGSRAIAFGTPEAGLNVAQGYNFAKQINQKYNNSDAMIDGFLGVAFGTALSGLSLRGLDVKSDPIPKVPKEGPKVVTERVKAVPDTNENILDKPKDIHEDELYQSYYDELADRLPDGNAKSPEIVEFLDRLLTYSSHNAEVSGTIINQTETEVRELIKKSTVEGWPKDRINQEIAKIIDNMEKYLKSDKGDLAQSSFKEEIRLQETFNPEHNFDSQDSFDQLVNSSLIEE